MYTGNFIVALAFIATLQNLEPQTAHNQQCSFSCRAYSGTLAQSKACLVGSERPCHWKTTQTLAFAWEQKAL